MTVGLIDLIGLVGGVILLFAFWRVNTGAWKVRSIWYELDNVIAAVMLTFYAYEKKAYVSIVLNIIWGIVAFRGVSSYADRRMKRDPHFRRGFRKGHRIRKRIGI